MRAHASNNNKQSQQIRHRMQTTKHKCENKSHLMRIRINTPTSKYHNQTTTKQYMSHEMNRIRNEFVSLK